MSPYARKALTATGILICAMSAYDLAERHMLLPRSQPVNKDQTAAAVAVASKAAAAAAAEAAAPLSGPRCTIAYPRGYVVPKGTAKKPVAICNGDMGASWGGCVQRYAI